MSSRDRRPVCSGFSFIKALPLCIALAILSLRPDSAYAGSLVRAVSAPQAADAQVSSGSLVPTASAPQAAHALIAEASRSSSAPGEDVFLARLVEAYVSGRSQILSQKVDAITLKKTSSLIEEGVYRSTWDIVVKFRLRYARPEEDPFLAGMVRCLSELKASSTTEWTGWAEEEIEKRREEIQTNMSFTQESREQITAIVEISDAGYIDAGTITLRVPGFAEAATVESLLMSVPRPEDFEAAGYRHLSDSMADRTNHNAATNRPGETPVSGGQRDTGSGSGTTAGPPSEGKQSPTGGQPSPAERTSSESQKAPLAPLPPTASLKSRPGRGQSDLGQSSSRIMLWAIAVLSLLMVVLVVSEAYRRRRR